MNIRIVPLEETIYEAAVRIAIAGNTGLEKDIRPRLKNYNQYFVA